MKRLGIWVALVGVAFALGSAGTSAREFTDAQGRKIEAEIESVRPPNVVLVRDGKSFVFPFAKLSEADQKYVKQWMVDNPVIQLDYRFEKEKISSKGDSTRKREKWAYNVTVENRGFTDLEGLKINYTIYKQMYDRQAQKKKTMSGTIEGVAEVPKIESKRKHVFQTDPIDTEKVNKVTKSRSDGITNTTLERWDESLTGITLTVTLGDKVVDKKEYGTIK